MSEPVPSPILDETVAAVADILGPELGTITVERAVIGLFFTGVKLSSGEAGACATPREAVPEGVCCPLSAGRTPFRALQGRPATELMRDALGPEGLSRAAGIATLNALAERCWNRRPHPAMELRSGLDAFDATEIRDGERTVLVGAFIPFLKELKRRRLPYLVLEQNPGALKGEELPFYRPAAEARQVVPQADILLITGATLLNDTLEDLLALGRPETRVTVVGPTVSLLPDPLLARGADVLGSVRVTAPDAFLDLLAEGGSAPHFLGRYAEKVALVRKAAAAGRAAA